MADKDKAGPSTASDSLIDFAALPESALDKYITYFELAPSYPPPPSKRSPSQDSAAGDESGNAVNGEEEDERGEASRNGGRRASRVSNRNIEEGNATTTSSRLRPRSPPPSSSETGMKRNASTANLEENGHLNGAVGLVTRGAAAADDADPSPSHFFDVQEADDYLAGVAKRHFAAQPQPKEGEVVVQFLYRCRAGDKILKVAT